ncbi:MULTISPECIES: DUF4230 domain-containing protein [Thermomonospora]|uniref:DUF4230 domain-containing protein n=1 Tax=Thermomonospora cellulosilytica TaxID=1411118 RepID=A0A7W3N502_9ACTN|nr:MULTISPECIES: DUF4230 domain-containing protein [Thermomonospora]MBA9007674.1 hypothetical protein [Thermomonospora cellulosilytica]
MTRSQTDGNERVEPGSKTAEATAPRRSGLRTALVAVVAAVAVVLALGRLDLMPDWLNPFGVETKDRTGPAVLKSIRDLSRYEAASGNFQVIVDLEKDARFLPSAVRGKRTLFIGTGSVDAYVDFSRLSSGAVTVNEDRTAATIRLPRAQLEPANLDPKRSYVFATQRGLLDRVGDVFSGNPNDQQQLYVLAAQRIQQAAAESGLRERADQNTKLMLESLLKSLGFTTVTVTITDTQ